MINNNDFLLDNVQRKEWHHDAPKGKRNVAGGVLNGYSPVTIYKNSSYGIDDQTKISVSCKRTGYMPVPIGDFAAGRMCLSCPHRTGVMPTINLSLKRKLLSEGIDICNLAFPEEENHSSLSWRYSEQTVVLVPNGCPHAAAIAEDAFTPERNKIFVFGRVYKTVVDSISDDVSVARYVLCNSRISKRFTPAAWRIVVDDDKIMMTVRHNSRFVDIDKENNSNKDFYQNFVLNVKNGHSYISNIHNAKKSIKNMGKKVPALVDTTYNMPDVGQDAEKSYSCNGLGVIDKTPNIEFQKAFISKLVEKFGNEALECFNSNPYIHIDFGSFADLFDSLSSVNRFPFLNFPVVRNEWERLPVRIRRRIGNLPRVIDEKAFIENFSEDINVPNEFINWGTYHFCDKQRLAQALVIASEAGVQSQNDKDLINQADNIINYIREQEDSRWNAYALREPLDMLTFITPAFCPSVLPGVTKALSDTTRKLAIDITKIMANKDSFRLNEELVSNLLRNDSAPMAVISQYEKNLIDIVPLSGDSYDLVKLPQKFSRGKFTWVIREATDMERRHNQHFASQYSTGLGTLVAIDKIEKDRVLRTVFMIYKSRFSIDGRRWTLAQRKSLRAISSRILQIIDASIVPGRLDDESRKELSELLIAFNKKCELFASCGKQYEIYLSHIDTNLQDELVINKSFFSGFARFLYKNDFGVNPYVCKNTTLRDALISRIEDAKKHEIRKKEKELTKHRC